MIEILMLVLIFIAGAFIGSFLNVVSDRLQNGEPIMLDRSHCENCKTDLLPKDLVPIFSFLFLKGSCRYCGTKLSYYYPLSEVLTGSLLAFIAYMVNIFTVSSPVFWLSYLYLAVIMCLYVVIILSDLKFRIIPNKIIAVGVVVTLTFMVFSTSYTLYTLYRGLQVDPLGQYLLQTDYFKSKVFLSLTSSAWHVLSAFVLGLFFYLLIVITKGKGMGGGDVKLAFLIGLFNGFPHNLLAIFLGFFTGAIYSLVLVLLRRTSLKSTIPFGPFLILGSIIAFAYGTSIINWYLSFL